MKNLFPGHFKPSKEELKDIWNTCLFVFDANILLNLYRYSDSTRIEFTKVLEKIQENIWIPHRAAEEYLNNRLAVIYKQEGSYVEAIKSIESLKGDLDNARHHPFVSPDVMKKVNTAFESLRNELEKNRSSHNKRMHDDDIKNSIASLFNDRVGMPYDDENLEKIVIEGERRYKQKVPPGYKDSSKKSDSDSLSEKCRAFGDLIIWNQIIDKSKDINKGIVLVIDDKKEDWWEIFNGKTIGPRPELVKEFNDLTNNSIYMYQADRFLELAQNYLGQKIDKNTVDEIRAVRKEFNEQYILSEKHRGEGFKNTLVKNLLSSLSEQSDIKESAVSFLSEEINQVDQKIKKLKETLDFINESRESISNNIKSIKPEGLSSFSEREKAKNALKELSNTADSVIDNIESLENKKLEIERQLISLLLK